MNKIHVYNASRMDENNMSSHRKMVLILNKLLCELLDGTGTPHIHTPHLCYQQILNCLSLGTLITVKMVWTKGISKISLLIKKGKKVIVFSARSLKSLATCRFLQLLEICSDLWEN